VAQLAWSWAKGQPLNALSSTSHVWVLWRRVKLSLGPQKTGLYGRNFRLQLTVIDLDFWEASLANRHSYKNRPFHLQERIPGVVVCSLLHVGLHLEICNFGWLKTEDSGSSWRRACQLFKQPGWWWGGLGKFSFLWDSWWFCCLPDTIADAKGEDFVWVLFVSGHVASVGALLSLE